MLDWRKQFGRPTGFLGSAVGHLMAVKNRERSEWVLSLLAPRPGERILEVGFGPGVDVARVAAAVRHGFVGGVDHSEVMVSQARRRNRESLAAGRVELTLGDAADLPWGDRSFDKAYAVNVAQFWKEGGRVLGELRRVLKPGGLLLLAVQPRSKGATEATATETGQALLTALAAAGFRETRLERRAMRPVSTVAALGLNAFPGSA